MNGVDQASIDAAKDLRVHVYRGLHLRGGVDDYKVIDQWIEKKLSLEDIERVLNHVHVYDLVQADLPEEEYVEIRNEIEQAWGARLAELDRAYAVEAYEGYGPEVTFYLKRS